MNIDDQSDPIAKAGFLGGHALVVGIAAYPKVGIAAGVVDRVVGVPGAAQVFEVLFEVLHEALVERPKVCRRVAEGVLVQERVEVPVDELPRSKPLLSETNIGRPVVFSPIQ